MDRESKSSFGALLREARLAKGLSQEALAGEAGVSIDAISALERGSRKVPQRQTLDQLLRALAPSAALRARLEAAAVRPSVPRVPKDSRSVRGDDLIDRPRGNLPRPLTSFFGRESELGALESLAGRNRLVTITGSGGVGKTRAALELSTRLAQHFIDGTWFVELGPLRDAALVPKAIAAALAILERTDTPLLDVIHATLRDKRLLLVFDNCEHLIDAAANAANAILTRAPFVTIVATSREALRVAGEAIYRLPTLDVPAAAARITPEEALRYSAVALLIERSRARDSSFPLNPANIRAAAEICRRLDGIPLALELAAAKTSVLSLEQIETRLSRRFALLTDGSRTALPRQQTLRALIDWSFDLLTPAEQEVFSRLAVFAGSWNLAAAEAVNADSSAAGEDVMEHLSSLVEKSLVAVETAGANATRFRMFETTREYAAVKLRERGSFDDVMRAHAGYVLAFVRNARTGLQTTPDRVWLDNVQVEIENIRTALEWCLRDRHDVAAGAEIAAGLGFFWDMRSAHEGTRWLLEAKERIGELDGSVAALVFGELVHITPATEEMLELARRSLQLYRAAGDQAGTAGALESLGRTLINLGRHGDAIQTLEEGLIMTRRAADDAGSQRMLALLAFTHLYAGDIDAAKRRQTDAGELSVRQPRVRDHALILRVQAEIALAAGDAASAVDGARRNLTALEQIGDFRRIGMARYLLARAFAAAHQMFEARIEATEAIRILSSARMPPTLVEAYFVRASTSDGAPDDERAARLIGFARARAATLAFQSSFFITDLVERTVAALIARLGLPHFEQLAAEGAQFDEARALAELDEVPGTRAANVVRGDSLDPTSLPGDAHAGFDR